MRIFILRKLRPQPASTANQRTGNGLFPSGVLVDLFESIDDQAAYGSAGTLSPMAQAIVQRFRNIDGGSDCHIIIMA